MNKVAGAMGRRAAALTAAGALSACAPAAGPRTESVAVPFVGCAADGQVGPVDAPASGIAPSVPPDVAPQLAYYASEHAGVLAPRGWQCFALIGSNGSFLAVAPRPLASDDLLGEPHPLKGPAVLYSRSDGGTSGRWAAVEAAARYFPERRGLIDRLHGMDLLPEGLRNRPYPADRIRRLDSNTIAFTTPPGARGEGTEGRLGPTRDSVEGLVILVPAGEDFPDTVEVEVRLPDRRERLAQAILGEVRTRSVGK
ncbi:MAG TPA: hypothetical protein VHM92_09645 [Allosphingosinicella sp.]|nr:hypothetical protein [Allosphingosinicella sp.]